MARRHLKRLLAPKFWRVPRKQKKWVVRPSPGPHKLSESIPLQIVVRDILRLADTAKEAKAILKSREVFVDGKARTNHKYPAGLMDVVSIPKLKQQFRIVPTAKGLQLIKISKAEGTKKICRINNKTTVKKSRLQLNLHDGRNLLAKGSYKTGDSLLIELPSQKILEHVKLEKGSLALITKGKNAGRIAKVKQVVAGKAKEPAKVVCEIGKQKVDVLKSYVFVVGKAKPLIKLSE